jgi:hypothetical protein
LKSTTPIQIQALFEDYQRALGRSPASWLDEVRGRWPDAGRTYAPAHKPGRREKQAFLEAYLLLRQGKRDLAAECFRDLTQKSPRFADPWIWLAAATDDRSERIDCLETAVLLETSHPLARDALAIALGRVSPAEGAVERESQPEIVIVKCPQCAGILRHEPGATQVECQYCGHCFALDETDLLEQQTELVAELRLKRRFQGQSWQEAERIARCHSCGAELIMTRHLARQCAFCGSTSVLVEDSQRALIRPDGFLPFEVSEQQASSAIQRAVHSKRRQSRNRPVLERLQGIYLPFWVFDGFVEARRQRLTLEGAVMPSRSREPVRRMLMFENLLYCAMDLPSTRLVAGLLPYTLDRLVPYEPHLLADRAAALYRRDVEDVAEEAYEAMLKAATQRTKPSTLERLSGWNVRRWYQVTTVTYQLVLLPVWAAVLRSEGRRSLVLLNGQTARATTGAPLRDRPPGG